MIQATGSALQLGDLSLAEWLHVFGELCSDWNARRWHLGDALNYGEERYGEQYAQAEDVAESYGLSPEALRQYMWVSSRYAPTERFQLPWSFHRECAGLEPAERRRMLMKAENGRWTRRELRDAVQDHKGVKTAPTASETALWRIRAARWKACAKRNRSERLLAENWYPGNEDAVERMLKVE